MPPEHDEALRGRLCGLRNLADRHFDLILRVGAVPVKDVSDRSLALKVARYRLTPGTCVGIFRGDGIAYAEQQVKRNNASYRLSVNNPPEVDLSALSCRWKPIPSKRDTVLSLLVIARNDHERSTYQRILNELNRLYDGDLNRGNPVNTSDMSYRSVGDCYRDEKRYTGNRWSLSYLFRLLEIVFAVALFRWKIPFYFVDAEHYRNALPEHSDYRKFDGMLRLTIDCSTEQLEEIIEILDEMHRNDRVFYGHHASSEALMTCFVENLNDGGHIHFIDGGNGGYAMAAIQLKQQVDRARENGKETESIRKRII